ncbi:MAG: hypothetical protein ACH346_03060 [Chthoniobacterales bacterium]
MKSKTPYLCGLIAIIFACLVGLFPVHNSDVWWHIAWGKKMLQLSTLSPAATDFYFTPTTTAYGRELINTFLGDISLALLYQIGGVIALQLLVLLFLFIGGAVVILVPMNECKKETRWRFVQLLLFFAFCLGTCQLQIVRNSLSSLAFFPATLALYSWHCRRGGWRPLIFSVLLLIFWSFLHPSYALGIIALIILYAGMLLDGWRKISENISTSHLLRTLAVLLLFFGISLTYSWQVRQLLVVPVTHVFLAAEKIVKAEEQKYFTAPSEKNRPIEATSLNLTKPAWGNSSLPLSGDFIPTWRAMRHPAATSSMLLSLVAFLLLIFYRGRNKIGMIILLGFTTYFGICYLRGTGYAAITAVFMISSAVSSFAKNNFLSEEKSNFLKKCIAPLSALLCLASLVCGFWLIITKQTEPFFMEKGRVFGFGKAVAFDDASYQFVQTHFLDKPCFTTMVTGSYASFFWGDHKKVFIDSFFAPHATAFWKDYDATLVAHDIGLLNEYGIQVAIVENNRSDWQYIFLSAQEWQPVAISLGTTVYAKRDVLPENTLVEILFTQADVDHSASPTTQRAVAAAYYNCILSLQLHHLGKVATDLTNKHENLFATLVNYLDSSQRRNIRQQPKGIKSTMLRP